MNRSRAEKIRNLVLYAPENYLTHGIDIEIDGFTPCLEHRKSGEIYITEISPFIRIDLKSVGSINGWNTFDWNMYLDSSLCKVKKLTIKGDEQIQGLIAYEPKEGYIEILLVESAPWNVKEKVFIGVGPHLFAIACKESFKLGFDGYVVFTAKTNLIEHYVRTMGAKPLTLRSSKLVLETEAAKRLVSTYF